MKKAGSTRKRHKDRRKEEKKKRRKEEKKTRKGDNGKRNAKRREEREKNEMTQRRKQTKRIDKESKRNKKTEGRRTRRKTEGRRIEEKEKDGTQEDKKKEKRRRKKGETELTEESKRKEEAANQYCRISADSYHPARAAEVARTAGYRPQRVRRRPYSWSPFPLRRREITHARPGGFGWHPRYLVARRGRTSIVAQTSQVPFAKTVTSQGLGVVAPHCLPRRIGSVPADRKVSPMVKEAP